MSNRPPLADLVDPPTHQRMNTPTMSLGDSASWRIEECANVVPLSCAQGWLAGSAA